MSRATTLIALVQTLLIILGFATLGIVLKLRGYPDDDPLMHWKPFVVFLREHGYWLLIMPTIWTLLATVVQRNIPARQITNFFGILLAVGVFGVFVYASVFPGTRGLLLLP